MLDLVALDQAELLASPLGGLEVPPRVSLAVRQLVGPLDVDAGHRPRPEERHVVMLVAAREPLDPPDSAATIHDPLVRRCAAGDIA
jgi:hypothetical protein